MILAVSGLASLLIVLIVLACPLMMILTMRGMHGGHGTGGHGGMSDPPLDHSQKTLDELEHERDLLNEEIAQRAGEPVRADHRGARTR